MKKYLEKIKAAQTIDELDAIVESAAFDENLTDAEYCDIYSNALTKAQTK